MELFDVHDPDTPGRWRIPIEGADTDVALGRAGRFCLTLMQKYDCIAVSVWDFRTPAGVVVFCQPPFAELIQDVEGVKTAVSEFIVSGESCPDPSNYS